MSVPKRPLCLLTFLLITVLDSVNAVPGQAPELKIGDFRDNCPSSVIGRYYVTADVNMTGIRDSTWKKTIYFIFSKDNRVLGRADFKPCPTPNIINSACYCLQKRGYFYTFVLNITSKEIYSGKNFFVRMLSKMNGTNDSPMSFFPVIRSTIKTYLRVGTQYHDTTTASCIDIESQKDKNLNFTVTGLKKPFYIQVMQLPSKKTHTERIFNTVKMVIRNDTTDIKFYYAMTKGCEKKFQKCVREHLVAEALNPAIIAFIGASCLTLVVGVLCCLKRKYLPDV